MVEADALGKLPDDYREVLVLLIPALTMETGTGTQLLTVAQRRSSFLELQPGLCKEGADQMRLLPQPPDGEVKLLVQLLQVPAHDVAQLDILQVMPPALVPG